MKKIGDFYMSNLGGKNMSEDTDRDTGVSSVVAGARITVDNSNPNAPVVTADVQAGGQVDSVVGGTNCSVDATDPVNPIVNADTQNNAKVTTKGDLEGFSTVAARIPVGTDAQVLTADSGETLGVKWATPSAGGDVATDTIFDAKGDLAGGTGADTAARLAVGANDQVLTADSAEATGMKWAAAAAGGGADGAKIEQTTDKAFGSGFQTLTFQTEVYDDNSFADLGTDNDRVTVPSGVTRVSLAFNVQYTNNVATGSNFRCQIEHYNSADVLQEIVAGQGMQTGFSDHFAGCSTIGVEVVATDYFIVKTICSDTSTTTDKYDLVIQDVTP